MQRRVLIVEDEATLRRVIAQNLVRRGLEVRAVGTAAEAIDVLVEHPLDLLLLDINLPDRSGWDVLRELRQRGIAVETIVVSAIRVGPDDREEFGPFGYLPKPFSLQALLRLVVGSATEETGPAGIA